MAATLCVAIAGVSHAQSWTAVRNGLTFRPRIWLMAEDSLKVHSAITFGLISFMNNMKAFSGFFT